LLAFQFLGVKPRTDGKSGRSERIFSVGHDRDLTWKRWLTESKLSIVQSMRAPCGACGSKSVDGRHMCIPNLRIRGECDDIVLNSVTGDKAIFEMKTMNDAEWKRLAAPKPEHIIQVQSYMFGHNVLRTVFNYENKNDQQVKAFMVSFDYVLWNTIAERCMRIMKQLAEGGTPERTPVAWDSRCNFFPVCATANFPELTGTYVHKHVPVAIDQVGAVK
jgi:hypothetical protein